MPMGVTSLTASSPSMFARSLTASVPATANDLVERWVSFRWTGVDRIVSYTIDTKKERLRRITYAANTGIPLEALRDAL